MKQIEKFLLECDYISVYGLDSVMAVKVEKGGMDLKEI